jgi:hypothetical protein
MIRFVCEVTPCLLVNTELSNIVMTDFKCPAVKEGRVKAEREDNTILRIFGSYLPVGTIYNLQQHHYEDLRFQKRRVCQNTGNQSREQIIRLRYRHALYIKYNSEYRHFRA